MTHDAATRAASDDEYAWFRDGSLPPSREDRVAEAVAMAALVFSLGIGLVIALLPVSAKAADTAAASLERSTFEIAPATPGHAGRFVAAGAVRTRVQLLASTVAAR